MAPRNNSSYHLRHGATAMLIITMMLLGWQLYLKTLKCNRLESAVGEVSRRVIVTSRTVQALADTIRLQNTRYLPGMVHHDTIIRHFTDTVALALRIAAAEQKHQRLILMVQDSIKRREGVIVQQQREIAALKEARRHLTVEVGHAQPVADTPDADLLIYPFKRKRGTGLFSPRVSYIRVYNKVPGGMVNGKPYYDFEQTNDEINQFLIQARSSYNFQKHTQQYGLGAELKINRLSLNGVGFYNPSPKPLNAPFTLSVGARYDIYRVRFK